MACGKSGCTQLKGCYHNRSGCQYGVCNCTNNQTAVELIGYIEQCDALLTALNNTDTPAEDLKSNLDELTTMLNQSIVMRDLSFAKSLEGYAENLTSINSSLSSAKTIVSNAKSEYEKQLSGVNCWEYTCNPPPLPKKTEPDKLVNA